MRRALVALCLVAIASGDAAAQRKGRFLSRSAFSSLDTAALMDSSEMRSLDPRLRFDSLMLQMLGFLNERYAPIVGSTTRIRSWEGFSTQAHPVAGILVDQPELDERLGVLRQHKGMAGVQQGAIEIRVNHVVQFVIGHEYAHLIQYALLPRDSVDSPNATRIVECAADIMGAALHKQFALGQLGAGQALDIALLAAANFGYEIGAANWLDGTAHPIPEHRMRCIQRGQAKEVVNLNELTAWAMRESRGITSVGSVVDRDKGVAVTRDSSVISFLSDLLGVATRGPAGLDDLRGPELTSPGAQGGEREFVLRRSLATPWRCVLRVGEGSAAVCDATFFGDAAREYQTLAGATREVFGSPPWVADTAQAPGSSARQESFRFTSAAGATTRVVVRAASEPGSPMRQMPAQTRVTLIVSVAR